MNEVIDLAVEAAQEAGKLLVDNFGKINLIESKKDKSLATNLDKEAENLIISKIKNKFPAHGILAEEKGGDNADNDYLWIIDPMDGTHNFIRNINIFGVSIGILFKKEFIGGVIYMPVDGELYTAQKGSGAYKNGEKISVSKKTLLKDCSISFDSSIKYSPADMLRVLGELSPQVFNIRMLGSSARQLSYLAEGKLDLAVEFHDWPWDFAAGVCIIREAGGEIAGLNGEPITYQSIGYVASNSLVHGDIQAIVKNTLNI
ncbi:MAG: inositol monophosphatase [Candidatus Omnitrophica bacterium]|nr:inositol monophosphatase [Candidatus Omnitrophota bacterium]MBD3269194.1 inositol monophosphatase [Candidatus Omnitrophota bacterium]